MTIALTPLLSASGAMGAPPNGDTGSVSRPLVPLIIGYGRAGRDLHARCVKDLLSRNSNLVDAERGIFVVDPSVDAFESLGVEITGYRSLDDLPLEPDNAVAHVCVPPAARLEVVEALAAKGYSRFILEKPLASDLDGARAIERLAVDAGLDIVVVANWLASRIVEELIDKWDLRGLIARAGVLRLKQAKSRISRTLVDKSHLSAFEVEMPHLVALAIHLCGPVSDVLDAVSTDLVLPDIVVRGMATANLTIRHSGGVISRIETDLESPIAERSMKVGDDLHSIEAFFPVSASDDFGQYIVTSASGSRISHAMLVDRTLNNFIESAYSYFQKRSVRPVSDVKFNVHVIQVLQSARELAAARRGAQYSSMGAFEKS